MFRPGFIISIWIIDALIGDPEPSQDRIDIPTSDHANALKNPRLIAIEL
jgi:hypothetical protein